MAISIVTLIRYERIERILAWFGKYSYSIYLFEMIMLDKQENWFDRFDSYFIMNVFTLVAICLAAIVYQEVTDCILKRGNKC